MHSKTGGLVDHNKVVILEQDARLEQRLGTIIKLGGCLCFANQGRNSDSIS